MQIPIAPVLNVKRWPIGDGANITLDNVVRRFAEGGIPETIVDDAFGFAQCFAKDAGPIPKDWTLQDMEDILSYSEGYTVLPPPYFPEERDPYPVSPFLPSQHEFINIAKFDLANWALPELAGLRREQYSEIARKIAASPRREVHSTGMVAKHNPHVGMRQRLLEFRQEIHHIPPIKDKRMDARPDLKPNASLRAKESGTSMCVDPKDVTNGGGHDPYNHESPFDDTVVRSGEPAADAQMIHEIRRFMLETGADALSSAL
ncbi:hypothetical protein K438DRAFT_1986491 [Mycena galopus ATCC 62051]|nr:hypothetical protein K438DRAFT_1986491 [Mycena galopus ATCC 62051]